MQLIKGVRVACVTPVEAEEVFFVGGGVKEEGPIPKRISVLRNENGSQHKLPFDCDAVSRGERMELNLPLLPGDAIVVPNH
jgi:hypothetical protein